MGSEIWYVLATPYLCVFFGLRSIAGGIVFARLFYKPAIVINSLQVARDLMDKRSGNYSDRPVFTLLEE